MEEKHTPERIKVFIERHRKICWESEYEKGEYCIGENKVEKFCAELLQENERLKQELKDEIQYRKDQVAEVQRDAAKEIDKYRQ